MDLIMDQPQFRICINTAHFISYTTTSWSDPTIYISVDFVQQIQKWPCGFLEQADFIFYFITTFKGLHALNPANVMHLAVKAFM